MRLSILVVVAFLLCSISSAQEETVPVGHPVYTFLKRMDVKGYLARYRDAVLPLARGQVARLLAEVSGADTSLSHAERGWLQDFEAEFRFDASGSFAHVRSLFGPSEASFGSRFVGEFSGAEKFLYASNDSVTSLFVSGLLDLDARLIRGDALGSEHSEFIQVGGRIRGTALGHIGFLAQATNAQFWGSRDLLARDPEISQSYGLYTTDAQNFDFSEGYIRYGSSFISVELGQERLLWGTGQDQQMVLSQNPRTFPFLRLDIEYKAIKYTFIHGWLLGNSSTLLYQIPEDTSVFFSEPVYADKFFAGHRFELSFPGVLDVGFSEMYIYSNRSPDLAYLNPFVLLESAQRSRGERDNGFWALDLRTRFIPGVQLYGTMLYDDIHFAELFQNFWYDRYAWQAGMIYADVATVSNTTLVVEYTHVEPWLFAHNRSRDGSYTSYEQLLGPRIGPNADSWFFRLDYLPLRNLFVSLGVLIGRKGQNTYDSQGYLVENVGADPLVPHRSTDPEMKSFLDGILDKSSRVEFTARFEIVNQIWIEGIYRYEAVHHTTAGGEEQNSTVILHLKTEL